MVTFKLKEENDRQLVYWYFPHGNEENGHGTIVIDRVLGKLDVTELAPDDRLVRHTVENQNRWRKAVNQMRNIERSFVSAVSTIVSTPIIILWSRAVRSSKNSLLSLRCCSIS